MKIAVTNCVLLNGGDAAILLAIVELLKRAFGPDTDVRVFDTHARRARPYYPELRVHQQLAVPDDRTLWPLPSKAKKALWRRVLGARLSGSTQRRLLRLTDEYERSLAALRDCDFVVSTGGTYLVDTYDVRPRMDELRWARELGKPVILYTQSIGEIVDPARRRAVARELSAAHLVLVRDRASRDNVLALGVEDTRCVECADVVFSAASEDALAAAAKRRLPERGADVVVSVRDWPFMAERGARSGMEIYRSAVAALVGWLTEAKGARVTFLSTCQGIPGYRYDDSKTAGEIRDLLPPATRAQTTLDRDFHRPRELSRRLARADLVVATRMHMAILALSAGTPVLPIAYEFKTRELFAGLGREDWVIDIGDCTEDALSALARTVLERVDSERAALFAGVDRMRRSATGSIELVRHALER